jgi:hypothetical protein
VGSGCGLIAACGAFLVSACRCQHRAAAARHLAGTCACLE